MIITQTDQKVIELVMQTDSYETLINHYEFNAINSAFNNVLLRSATISDTLLSDYIQTKIRTPLNKFLETKKNNQQLSEAAFQLSLLITYYWPLNSLKEGQNNLSENKEFICPITHQEIAEQDKVMTTQGNLFSKPELIAGWKSRQQWGSFQANIHPLTRAVISNREQLYILGANDASTIARDIVDSKARKIAKNILSAGFIFANVLTGFPASLLLSLFYVSPIHSVALGVVMIFAVCVSVFILTVAVTGLLAYAAYKPLNAFIRMFYEGSDFKINNVECENDRATSQIINDINTQAAAEVLNEREPGAANNIGEPDQDPIENHNEARDVANIEPGSEASEGYQRLNMFSPPVSPKHNIPVIESQPNRNVASM